MNYLSVCSGIEAASVAWHDLKWQPQAFSEIEAFPSAVLKYRFPEVPNMGDMTKYKEWNIGRETIDLIVGGTPCQSFSVAGLRKGLDDPRGNLMLVYLGLIDHFKPKWIVWENVPGVLSSNKGRDFSTFIGALAELRYGFAYRVLDAQFFGVPQRRRRVFVVGYLGDWRPAAAVLFESESLRRNTPKSRKTGKRVTSNVENGTGEYYESHPHDSRITGPHDTANTVSARYGTGGGNTPIVMSHGQANAEIREDGQSPTLTCNHEAPILAMHTTGAGFWKEGCGTLRAREQDSHENLICIQGNMIGRSEDAGPKGKGYNEDNQSFTLTKTDIHAVCFEPGILKREGSHVYDEISGTLRSNPGDNSMSVAYSKPVSFDCRNLSQNEEISATLQSKNNGGYSLNYINPVKINSIVRRLTPLECERLQGFPDDHTKIPWRNKGIENCPDGPRYKAIGNSMAVPVMKWIGNRINLMEEILKK